jgi:xylulokinase
VIDETGRKRASSVAEYSTSYDAAGGCTQRPSDWLQAAARVFSDLGREVAGAVDAVAVTAPAHVIVLLDGEGQPLGPSLLARDRRPTEVAEELRARLDEIIFERTSVSLTAGWCLPQLRWLRSHLGSDWKRLSLVLPQKDFVRYAMTGSVATDPTDAAGTALYDARAGHWVEELLQAAGVSRSQMPPIVSPRDIGGHVTASWARATGLRQGIPLLVGATDTALELLSVGMRDAGSLVKIASTGTVVDVTASARPHRLLMTYPHVVEGRWYSVAATSFAASARAWIADILGLEVSSPKGVAAFDRLASQAVPGSKGLLFLPFLAGERTPYWDPRLRGGFIGLTAAHGRAEIARSVLEGVAFALRACAEVTGLVRTECCLTGGGLESRLWRKILVSILGFTGTAITPHGPGYGAALLSRSAQRRELEPPPVIVRRTIAVLPDDDWAVAYDRLFPTYNDAAMSITPLSHSLDRL